MLLLGLPAAGQQRANTTTYLYNGLLLNPAYAGSLNVFSAIGVYRKQWVNVSGAPEYLVLSAHNSFVKDRIGVGLVVGKDRVGVHEDTGIDLSYAYKIRTGVGILAMGLQGSMNFRISDFESLAAVNANDPLLVNSNRTTFNFGSGLYFANATTYGGFSVPFILENLAYDLDGDGG